MDARPIHVLHKLLTYILVDFVFLRLVNIIYCSSAVTRNNYSGNKKLNIVL